MQLPYRPKFLPTEAASRTPFVSKAAPAPHIAPAAAHADIGRVYAGPTLYAELPEPPEGWPPAAAPAPRRPTPAWVWIQGALLISAILIGAIVDLGWPR